MLVLTRKKEEAIRIGNDVVIKIIDIDHRQVKLGIEAPPHVSINRQEVYVNIQNENEAASKSPENEQGLRQIAELLKNWNAGEQKNQ